MDNRIDKKVSKGVVAVARLFVSHYQKPGTITAEFKQNVNTITLYPDKTIRDNLQGNIYEITDYEESTKNFSNLRTDVTWIDVPESQQMQDVTSKLATFPNATLYRILSNQPIMSDGSERYYNEFLEEGEEALAAQFKDRVANGQVLKYGSDADDGSYNKGDLILDRFGKPQFKACFLDETGVKQDVDLRVEDETTCYKTMEILMILNSSVSMNNTQIV